MSTTTTPAPDTKHVDLAITGMTCASCSARIERKLNKIDGVDASVNLATERASVSYAAPVTVEDLLHSVRSGGYGATPVEQTPATPEHVDVAQTSLLRRFIVAAALTVPVVLLAMGPWHPVSSPWWQLALTTPVVAWAAWPFHRAAAVNARHLSSTMDTLVSIGVLSAYLWSLVMVLGGRGHEHLYFEVAAVVTTFLLLGRWLEARARHRGRSAIEGLMNLGAKDVAVQRIDPRTRTSSVVRIPIDRLAVGDHFVVHPGEQIATDGVVVDGTSAVDDSMLTGEPIPVDVEPSSQVTGGAINSFGRLVIEATRVGSETTLAAITKLVADAQSGKAPIQRLADRVSSVFVPIVLALALLAFLGWWLGTGDAARALEVAVAVLVIACPCALGLATPTALLAGTSRGAELGILIKGPEVLEDTRRIDTIVLDKTGTVTSGKPRLVDLATAGRLSPTAALKAAAVVESGSEHPIAHAITTAAHERAIELPQPENFHALPGAGARADIGGMTVTVGQADLFDRVPDEITTATAIGTRVFVGWQGTARAALTVADEIRPTSPAAIERFHGLGLQTYLLTGDNARSATRAGEQIGIPTDHVIAEVKPADKHAVIQRLRREGHIVAMTGDGINDAAALSEADLGLAMGGGTDIAMDSADIVLMRPDLQAAADAIELSRRTLRVIKQNLAWAFGYNIAAIPLAIAGVLNPMIAGAAMAASSVLVVTNSLRLRGFGG